MYAELVTISKVLYILEFCAGCIFFWPSCLLCTPESWPVRTVLVDPLGLWLPVGSGPWRAQARDHWDTEQWRRSIYSLLPLPPLLDHWELTVPEDHNSCQVALSLTSWGLSFVDIINHFSTVPGFFQCRWFFSVTLFPVSFPKSCPHPYVSPLNKFFSRYPV